MAPVAQRKKLSYSQIALAWIQQEIKQNQKNEVDCNIITKAQKTTAHERRPELYTKPPEAG